MKTIDIKIEDSVFESLQSVVDSNCPVSCDSVADVIEYILSSASDGLTRSGSWERQYLVSMGLVDAW